MRIEGPPRISRPIPLTPLVDVVFLLLMFFMLSTTFARHGQLGTGENREAAAAPAAVAAANTPPGLVIDVGHGPAVSINGSAVAIADLVARLKTLHQRGVTSGIIRARRDADVQDLVSVMELVRTSGLPSMTLSGR
jgi:biopolymer transport protein ExbD